MMKNLIKLNYKIKQILIKTI